MGLKFGDWWRGRVVPAVVAHAAGEVEAMHTVDAAAGGEELPPAVPAFTTEAPEVQAAAQRLLEGFAHCPESGSGSPPETSTSKGGAFRVFFSSTGVQTSVESIAPPREVYGGRRFSVFALPRLLGISETQAAEWRRAGVLPRPDGFGLILEPEFEKRMPFGGTAPQFSRQALTTWAERVLAGKPANVTWAELVASGAPESVRG